MRYWLQARAGYRSCCYGLAALGREASLGEVALALLSRCSRARGLNTSSDKARGSSSSSDLSRRQGRRPRRPPAVEGAGSSGRGFDVVVVGGGAVGWSVAYHLALLGPAAEGGRGPRRVAVVERDCSYRHASSPLSVGGVRQQFSLPENIKMSMFGASFFEAGELLLGQSLQFRQHGYLFLASSPSAKHSLHANLQAQRAAGVSWVELLGHEALRERFPWGRFEEGEEGTHGTRMEGWLDPWALLTGLKRKAVELGVELVQGEVTGLRRGGSGTIRGVTVRRTAAAAAAAGGGGQGNDQGTRPPRDEEEEDEEKEEELQVVEGGVVVNAAGAFAHRIVDMCNNNNTTTTTSSSTGEEGGGPSPSVVLPVPIRPRRRVVFVVHCQAPQAPPPESPLVVDCSTGVYWRPEGSGGRFLAGVSPEAAQDPDCSEHDRLLLGQGATADEHERLWEGRIWPAMAQRVQAFAALKVVGSWAGFYDYNTLDQNALLGPHPHVPNLVLATGFSGHGLQHAPAAGRAVAEMVVLGQQHQQSSSLDLSRLAPQRLLTNTPLLERNIV